MKIEYHNDEFRLSAEIYPFVESYSPMIHIDRHRDFGNFKDMRPAEINWSCIGAQSIETAEQFTIAMQEAIKIGKEFNEPVHLYQIEVILNEPEKRYWTVKKLANNEEQARKSIRGAEILSIKEIND